MKQKTLTFLLGLLLALCLTDATACRYTVREIGYSRAYDSPYQLLLPIPEDFPDALRSEAEKLCRSALGDANISARLAGRQVLDSLLTAQSEPRAKENEALLISPRGRILRYGISLTPDNWKSALWDILDWACLSPVRKQINQRLTQSYCVVLFLPGRDSRENALYQARLEQSIQEIKKIMPSLPKPVSRAPALLILDQEQMSQEDLLLWSLECDSQSAHPRAAVIYGRARRLGPVLEKETFTEQNLISLLALVGADCECGLDRSGILGLMLPSRWGGGLQQAVADELGFDVENPAVLMEMEQILSLNVPAPAGEAKASDLIADYREELVELLSPSASPSAAVKSAPPRSLRTIFLISFVGIGCVLALSALVLHWKMKKRNPV
ncbi:MAG TPA: hypothetical protein PK843_02765 [bacterium]|nr:hypothetical protein [bacterium]HPN33405.1 hypothetical protein [bacterium]